jgi:hypothetical protein
MSMTRRNPAVWIGALAVLALPVALAACDDVTATENDLAASVVAAQGPDLSGTWELNLEESTLPERPRRAMRGDRGGPRRARGPRGPRGLARTLEISQDESSVTFTRGDRPSRTVYTDGRVTSIELPNGNTMEFTARWDSGALTVTHEGFRGGTMAETYTLDGDGKLHLKVVREGGVRPGPGEVEFVYERQ